MSGFACLPTKTQSHINKLESNGISVSAIAPEPGELFTLHKSSGYIRYNLHHYSISGFAYEQEIDANRFLGKVIWIGFSEIEEPCKNSIYVGVRLVSSEILSTYCN